MTRDEGKPGARRAAGDIARTVNAGFAHHQAGRLDRAEALYRKALARDPEHAEALHLLGIIAHQNGKFGSAIALIERALPALHDLPEAHLNLGNALREAGKFTEAADSYRRAIALEPDYGMAHSNLARALNDQGLFEAGLDSSRRGVALIPDFPGAQFNFAAALIGLERFAEAEAPLRRALELMPDQAETHGHLGRVLFELGRLDEAVASYQRAVALEPDHPATQYNLGKALHLQNRLDDAVSCYRRALALEPNYVDAHNNLGVALQMQGRLAEAVRSYRRALALRPDNPEAHYNLGNALGEQKSLAEAVKSYRRAIRLKPDFVEAHNNLGNLLSDMGRTEEAIASFRRALALAPGYALAHNGLGNMMLAQNRLDEAIACYRRALALKPDYMEAHNNLGLVLRVQGRLNEAVASCERALALQPDFAWAHYNLALALMVQEKLAEAKDSLRRAMAIDPDSADASTTWFEVIQRICDWSDYRENEQRVRTALVKEPEVGTAFIVLTLSSTPEEQFECARRVAVKVAVRQPTMLPPPRARPSKRIRLGYLSGDFRRHPVALLIAGLIERHDRRRFEVAGYSWGPEDGSAMRARLTEGFDRFIDIDKIPHRQAAERIYANAPDILIDLMGYTGNCRPAILACRPAPIQANYLGYPGTMGAEFIDYIIVDRFVVPPDQQPFYTERLVHLPDCYLCNDNSRAISAHTPSRAECGLPEEGFVFCCFNNSYKITPTFFDIWMRLLRTVPRSVLWLPEGNPWAKANLAREAAARGVAPERVVFAPRLAAAPEYLARLRRADLFLDTLPYNAHTTASDALWAGLPLLTCAGNTFAGRVAASLLRAIGLDELVTTSLEEYEALALRLACEPERFARLRARLKRNRRTHPLFDTERFTRNLEAAFTRMWETWQAGRPPTAFSVLSSGETA